MGRVDSIALAHGRAAHRICNAKNENNLAKVAQTTANKFRHWHRVRFQNLESLTKPDAGIMHRLPAMATICWNSLRPAVDCALLCRYAATFVRNNVADAAKRQPRQPEIRAYRTGKQSVNRLAACLPAQFALKSTWAPIRAMQAACVLEVVGLVPARWHVPALAETQ